MILFSDRLRAAREAKGLTQPQLAEKLGVSKGAVGNWESGANPPDPTRLRKIADILSTSEEYLRGESDTLEAVKIPEKPLETGFDLSALSTANLDQVFDFMLDEYRDQQRSVEKRIRALGNISVVATHLMGRLKKSLEASSPPKVEGVSPEVATALGAAGDAQRLAQELSPTQVERETNERKRRPGGGDQPGKK